MVSLLRYLETRMRTASSEKEMEWVKLEYRTRQYEFGVVEDRYNDAQYKAKRYSEMLNVLVNLVQPPSCSRAIFRKSMIQICMKFQQAPMTIAPQDLGCCINMGAPIRRRGVGLHLRPSSLMLWRRFSLRQNQK